MNSFQLPPSAPAGISGTSGGRRFAVHVVVAVALVAAMLMPAALQAPPAAAAAAPAYVPLTPARILDTRVGVGAPLAKVGANKVLPLTVTGVGGVPATGVSAVVLNLHGLNATVATSLTVYPTGVARPSATAMGLAPGAASTNLQIAKVGTGGGINIHNVAGTVDLVADVAGYYTAPASAYVPLTPSRIVDTRSGLGGPRLGADQARQVTVTGVGGVPATGVSAVVVNLHGLNASTPTSLEAYPTGEPRPNASVMNPVPGVVRSSLQMVKVGAGGRIDVYNPNGTIDLLVDVTGYFTTPAGAYMPVTPARIVDTPLGVGGGSLGADESRQVTVTGLAGVPATGVSAVALNLHALNAITGTWLTAHPNGEARPDASAMSSAPGVHAVNLQIVKVGAGGSIDIYNALGTVDLVVDVVGYLTEPGPVVDPTTGNVEFSASGVVHGWTVPAGVTEVDVEVWGAQGGGTWAGLGGYTRATMAVTPGEQLQMRVGGKGGNDGAAGWNGGGQGGIGGAPGGGGGGATDVRTGAFALGDRAVVGGGGGGAASGGTGSYGTGGSGGGQSGGIGRRGLDAGYQALTTTAPGTQTSGFQQGVGQNGVCTGGPCSGAGGGGFWGGFAGSTYHWASMQSAGGGGSGHVKASEASPRTELNGVRLGSGLVRLRWPVITAPPSAPAAKKLTFKHTGGAQWWTVPDGLTAVSVEAWGAQGGGTMSGLGGYVQGTVTVIPGQTLQVNVGGQGQATGAGGYGGGGSAVANGGGGGGGGASEIRIGGVTRDDRALMAAGGGGQGSGATPVYGAGGAGGGFEGGIGQRGRNGLGGPNAIAEGAPGTQAGGNDLAGGGSAGCDAVCGGGGGGGYWGGGSGGVYPWSSIGSGGGGGSSHVTATVGSMVQSLAGVRQGHGEIRISWPPVLPLVTAAPAPGSASFAYTGQPQYWTVPAGVNGIEVETWGAEGGGAFGGKGGYVKATLPVAAGLVLQLNLGGAGSADGPGGWNGGANGVGSGDGGGGGTDVRVGGTHMSNRWVVAGGGGGQSNGANASYGSGGCGGGVEGCRGGTGSHWFMNPPYYYGADPGTQTGGAAPGQGSTASFCDPGSGCPGGGGGGYFGGGSGGTYTYSSIAGGGAGGSGFVTPYAVTGLLTQGGNSGNGRAVIRWPVPIEITQSFGDDPYGEVVASVSTGSGNLVQSARDIDVATAGPDLQLERTYNGLDTKAGAFGRGWSWTYETRLAEVDANNVTITHASGRREAHAKKADGTYTAPPGYASKLTRLADGWRLETKDRTVLHFDTGGALVRIIDRHGRTLELVSISGRLQRAQDIASGRTLTFTWVGDRITRVESSPVTIGATTAPLVWRYTYVADRLTRACDARYPTTTGEKCTVYGYDGSGRLTTVTTPKGHLSIKASYRTDGRVNWVENADGDRHTFAYGGAITQVTDPLGRKTSYLYDLRLRTARIIDPQVRATTFVYDEKGFRSQVINQAGFRTTSTHDARGNVLSQTNAEGATTWFTYDADDQLKERRDPRSASSTDNTYRTTFTYDRGEVATETSPPTAEKPAGVVKTSTYTVQGDDHGFGPVPGGLLRTHNDGAGTITYDYDGEGDRRRQTNPTGPTNPTGLITETDHDQLGRTRSTTQRIGAEVLTTDQDVDPIGQVVLVRDPRVQDVIDGHWHQRVTRTTFDQNTNPTRVEVTDEGGSTAPTPARVTTVDYDKVDRAFVVNDPEGGQATRRFDKKGNPVEVTDAMGRRFVTDYDANDRATQVTLVGFADDPVAGTAPRDVVVHRYEYDQVGRVVAERTPAPGTGGLAGQVPATSVPMVQRRTAYDRADRVTRLVVGDFVNRDGSRRDLEMSSYKFDLAGNVIEEKTGGAQRQLLHTYDQAGMRQDTTLVLPEGNRITEFDYDSQGNTTRAAVKAAPAAAPIAEARATYDPSGALTSEVVENGAVDLTTTHDVDAAGRRRSTTDPRGGPAYTTNFDYDVLGRLVQVTKPAVDVESDGGTPTATRPVRRLAYDAVGNKVTELDERGGRTRRTFDRLDRPTRLDLPAYTPPGGGTVQPNEQLRYDRAGNVLSKTDRRGQVTDWDYDARNRPVRQRDPLVVGETARGEVRTGYDDAGNAVRRTDQNGAVVRWSHDQLARPRSETVEVRQPAPAPPLSFTTTVDHDDLGNRTFTEDATGVQQTAKYNGASQLVDAVDDLGKISTTTYDVAGRPLTQKDPLNRKTRNTYDLAGRMLAVEQLKPLVDATVLSTTRFGYDPAGNRTEVRSARSSSPTDNAFLTTFGYDALNQLRSVVEPVDATRSVTTAYGYDAAGNRTRTTNGANATTVHTWNPWNASEATIEPATAAHPTASDRTFTTVYDSGGLPVEERQPGATVTRSFDALGQVRTEAGTGTGLAAATRTFSWDRAGRLTGFGDPAGAVTLVNDDRGLLLSASTPGDPATATSTFGYDGAGRMIRRTDGAGTTTATYDARGLLDVVTDPLTGGTTDHGRNDAGQVNGIAYATTPVTSRTVGFDDSGRIASDSLAQGTTQKWSATYGYDTESNVTAKTVTAPGNPAAGASTYDYDRMGRLNKWTNPATAVTTYDYDGAGNRTQAGADAFTYDARNRMLTAPGATSTWTARGTLDAVEQGAVTTDVDFDALGRQLKSGATTNDYDSLDRLTRTGATALSYAGLEIDPVTNGATKYARSPRGELVATNEGGAGRFVGEDRHGDVAFALSTTASVDATRVYDPWGKVVGAAGLTGLGVGFQGDVTDAATGQVWMGARWYDPATARFTSRDTVAGGTARPTQQNRYAYGLDDPLGQFDPDGRCSWCRDAWDATAGKVVTAFNDHVVQPVFNNVIKPVAQTAWKGGKALAGATGAAIRNGVSTAARAVGQAASACWQSQTCRRAAVGVALVAAGVAMPALVPGMAASGLFGLGTGAVTCGGNAGCMIDQTLGGIAGGLVPGGGLLRTISGEFVGSFTSQFLEGKIDGGRLFFDVTVGVLTDQAGKRMGTGLGRRDIGRSPANRRNISADNFGPAHRAQKKPAELLESGPYDDLAKRSVKDGMTPDHIPAHAANRREIEDKLGRKLTPEEDRDLHKKGICLMVPTCDHQQVSDTYGGRNSESRIAGDAAAQRAGAERSLAVWRKHFIAAGMKPAEVEAKLAEVHRKNVAIGRYPA